MKLFVILFLFVALIGPSNAASSPTDACEQIEKKFYDFLTGGPFLDPSDPDVAAKIQEINDSAQTYWDTLEKNPDRTFLWANLPMEFTDKNLQAASYEMTNSFLRLSVMCQAYRTKGGRLYENQELGSDVAGAILWMNENKFKIDGKTYGNWWDWQVGSPLRFIDCLVMMKDKMTAQQYEHCVEALRIHVKEGKPSPGDANVMWNLFIRLLIGVLCKDDASLKTIIDDMDTVWFKYSTEGNGFYADGSYLMHGTHPYTGSYGASAIESAAKLAYLVNGTVYDLSPESKNLAIRWIKEAYAPVIYNGLMMDMVRGRSMSRETESDHLIGHVIIRSMYLFTLVVPESEGRAIQELIKHWITAATHRSIYYGKEVSNNNNYVFFINELKRLMNDANVRLADKPVFHKQFPSMASVVHSRPDFTFAISMYSHIVKNYEAIIGENLKGWNTGAGMTYLYNGDLGQFSDDFWPTVDPYRLPGTTVNQKSETAAHTLNGDSWAGGTSIDNLYGIAGMHLKPHGQTLAAKKSWFMFDDEIVALGSGINATDNKIVETIIENRKLKPDNSNEFLFSRDLEESAKPTWAYLSGSDANSDIGYYFPNGLGVKIERGERSGNWRSINNVRLASLDRELKANYLTLYFDHGVNPKDASYSYVILPNKSAQQVASYAFNPDIIILENSVEAHGVYEKNLHLTGVNFWEDAAKTVGPITADRKSSVIIRETDTEIFVSISDPTKRSGTVTVRIESNALECSAQDDNVNIVQLSPAILFTVDVTDKNGLPSYISFKKGKTSATFSLQVP
ncbi:MAG: polysaccharide lyase 8 family protein [Planctomycetaceae bacterium]|nr:polysaccharide lyase 8 family protein [Planctomycetaceae bacterium]